MVRMEAEKIVSTESDFSYSGAKSALSCSQWEVTFKTHEDNPEKTRLVLMCYFSLYPLYKQQMVHRVIFY